MWLECDFTCVSPLSIVLCVMCQAGCQMGSLVAQLAWGALLLWAQRALSCPSWNPLLPLLSGLLTKSMLPSSLYTLTQVRLPFVAVDLPMVLNGTTVEAVCDLCFSLLLICLLR